jgi:nicotinamidase-related amidase
LVFRKKDNRIAYQKYPQSSLPQSSEIKEDTRIMGKDYTDHIQDYNIRRAWPRPEKTALLVIDMQIYFKPLTDPILPNIISLIDMCRSWGVKIFFTRHGHLDPARDGGMLREWWGDLIQYDTPDWELIKDLDIRQEDTIIEKNRYSAFFGTDLNKQLQERGIKNLIICGVMTNCCCETTARDAFVHDYRVFFVADATAAANEELHIASLKNLAYGFAHIVTSHDLYKSGNRAGRQGSGIRKKCPVLK